MSTRPAASAAAFATSSPISLAHMLIRAHSPRTATDRASAVASGSNRPTRTSTDFEIRSGTSWSTAEGSMSRTDRPSRRNSPRSSESRNGLPPVASEHARQSRSPAAPPRSARTRLATAASLNGCGRRTGARASSISDTRSPRNPSAPVRTDSATRIGSPCNRGARCSRNLSDGSSAQCASSTTKTSGPRSARLATSQYRPCSVANAMSAVFCARATSVNTGPASCAAPDSRRSRSAASSLRTAALQQLAHDAEAEAALQLASAGAVHRHPVRRPRGNADTRVAPSSRCRPAPRSAAPRPHPSPPRPARHRLPRGRPRGRAAGACAAR